MTSRERDLVSMGAPPYPADDPGTDFRTRIVSGREPEEAPRKRQAPAAVCPGSHRSSNRLEIEARIEILARRREVLDPGIGHEEVGRLLQPVGDGAVRVELLPVVRREHLLRLE